MTVSVADPDPDAAGSQETEALRIPSMVSVSVAAEITLLSIVAPVTYRLRSCFDAAVGIVEEVDGRGMFAGGKRTHHVEGLCLTRRMRGGRGLGATDLLAIDRDDELCVALKASSETFRASVSGPLPMVTVPPGVERRRIANCSATSKSRIPRRQTLAKPFVPPLMVATGPDLYQESTNG